MRAEDSFFGFEAPRADGLFFALFPDEKGRAQLGRAAERLCIRHRLGARPLVAARLHISLLGFGEHSGLPTDLVAGAVAAAERVSFVPFQVTFDRAISFLGRPHPLVLCGGDGVAGLIALRRALGAAVERAGLGRVRPHYTPHVTLLYDAHAIEGHAIEPVSWTVREFVLVHSQRGRSRYIPLGRWSLNAGARNEARTHAHHDLRHQELRHDEEGACLAR